MNCAKSRREKVCHELQQDSRSIAWIPGRSAGEPYACARARAYGKLRRMPRTTGAVPEAHEPAFTDSGKRAAGGLAAAHSSGSGASARGAWIRRMAGRVEKPRLAGAGERAEAAGASGDGWIRFGDAGVRGRATDD